MTEDIRDADHVARYCSPRKLESDGTPAPGASRPRDRDNGCRSVGWPECFGGSVDDNIPHVRAELRRHYETGESGGLAALNVGMAKRAVRETRSRHQRQEGPAGRPQIPCMRWRVSCKQRRCGHDVVGDGRRARHAFRCMKKCAAHRGSLANPVTPTQLNHRR